MMGSALFSSKALQDAVDLARAQLAGRLFNGALWQALVQATQVSEEELARAMLEWQGVAVVADSDRANVVRIDDEGPARDSTLLPVRLGNRILLLSEDPWAPAAIAKLGAHAGALPALATPGQMDALRASSAVAVRSIAADEPARANSSPVVDFVEAAILRAYDDGASDIHFETDRSGIGIKYRLDGVMIAGVRMDDRQRAEEAISRIKVMAQLDITERRRPQDGRIHWTHPAGQTIDLRVSIMPSIFGEDAVLRLLDKAQLRHGSQRISLDALGFDAPIATAIRALAGRPHGMLLVTGPTGSGKTTTLYAALSEVNDGLEKIVTIEDPVEYELAGVLQIPVNEKKGLTFATGLRSILRHDPDKILVGEIRDSETAEIAVQSALTGHTVFTTVHANSVFDVLGRFQHFGIERFALASALNGIVVQRLLRRVCQHCRKVRTLTEFENQQFASAGLPLPEVLPTAVGCDHCRMSGYRGRLVLAEVHKLSAATRDLVVNRGSMSELSQALYGKPQDRLFAIALDKVSEGMTTIEEVSRVVGLE